MDTKHLKPLVIIGVLCCITNTCTPNLKHENDINHIIAANLPQYRYIMDGMLYVKWDTLLFPDKTIAYRINKIIPNGAPTIDYWEKVTVLKDSQSRLYMLRETLDMNADIRELDLLIHDNPQKYSDKIFLAEVLKFHFQYLGAIDIAVVEPNSQKWDAYQRRVDAWVAESKQKICRENFNNALRFFRKQYEKKDLVAIFFGELDVYAFVLSFNGINHHINCYSIRLDDFFERLPQRCY